MIEVYKTEKVPENCSTCLYFSDKTLMGGCAHADRQKDWLRYALLGCGCPSYWLNQHKYRRVER
jgi:hypothetical protein